MISSGVATRQLRILICLVLSLGSWVSSKPGIHRENVCHGNVTEKDFQRKKQVPFCEFSTDPATSPMPSHREKSQNPSYNSTRSPVTTAPVEIPSCDRMTINDLKYHGAFRLKPGPNPDGSCDSSAATHCSINYAVGTLAYNAVRHSLFVVGHAQANYIAEYSLQGIVPSKTVFQVSQLPVTDNPIQPFTGVLQAADNPEGHNKITGLMCYEDELIVNSEDWYDAAADNHDTTLVVRDSSNLFDSTIDGYFEMSGRANAAGYMGKIPASLQQAFGGAEYYTGWSSVYSITSRYSQGPSLWTFRPQDLADSTGGPVTSKSYMNFPYSGGPSQWLSPTATYYAAQGIDGPFAPADPIWNALSKGMYGFFAPHTNTFMVIGSTGGLRSGIGYKAVQSNGNVCGGPCPFEPDDYYNYYWLFDVDDIQNTSNTWAPRPYEYGEWKLPVEFVTNPSSHLIIGGTVDDDGGLLYVALSNAAQVGNYDRPPLILTFELPTR